MVAFCASCSENALHHSRLHEIDYVPQEKHLQEKNTLLKEQRNLKQKQKDLLEDIDNIVFE
jgi:hypothetical protein